MKYKKGVDVSQWQGTINWQKVKDSGVEFAMLRAGYGKNVDPYFIKNATECNRLNIPIGIYWFSYAKTAEAAKAEAEKCISTIKPYKIEYPVCYDFEDDSVKNASKAGITVTKKLASDMARAFLSTIDSAGYVAMNYSNPAYLSQYFDAEVIANYPVWLAQWPYNPNPENPPRICAMWQYSEKGSVPGISGNVDMDACYEYYPLKKETQQNSEKQPKQEEEKMSGKEIYDALNEYMNSQPIPEWARDEYRAALEAGITDGTRPMQLIPRYQAAIMALRAKNI